jgi:hypothetical protein
MVPSSAELIALNAVQQTSLNKKMKMKTREIGQTLQ